jgi:hypothetical protein
MPTAQAQVVALEVIHAVNHYHPGHTLPLEGDAAQAAL